MNVAVNGDGTVEPSETLSLKLSKQSKNAVLADNKAVGTIRNDD